MNEPGLRSFELAYIANPPVSALVPVGPGRFSPAGIESLLAPKYRDVEAVCAVADAPGETVRQLERLRDADARVKLYPAPAGISKDPARLAAFLAAKATGKLLLAAPPGTVLRHDGLHAMVAAAETLGHVVAGLPGSVRALLRKRAAAKADRDPRRYLHDYGSPPDGMLFSRAFFDALDLPARQKNPFDPSFCAYALLRVAPERFRCVPAGAFARAAAAPDLDGDAPGLAFELARALHPLKAYPDWSALLAPDWDKGRPGTRAQADASVVHGAFFRLLRCWRAYGHGLRQQIIGAAAEPFARVLRLTNAAPPPGVVSDRGDRAALWGALTAA